MIMTDTLFTDSNKSRMCAYMHILCVSSGTQECKILPSSRFFPPAEDHSFSTRLSGQLLLLSVAPYASFLFISLISFFIHLFTFLFTLSSFVWVCYNVTDLFWVPMCIFKCLCCVAFIFVFKRDLSHLTSKKLWFLETRSSKHCPPRKPYRLCVCMYICSCMWVSLCFVAVHFVLSSM